MGKVTGKYATIGATLGSVFPGVGTAVGGAVGLGAELLIPDEKSKSSTPSSFGFRPERRKSLTREIIEQEILKGGLQHGKSKNTGKKQRKS